MDLEALGPEDEDAELRDYVSVYIGEADAPGLVWVEGELAIEGTAEIKVKKGTGRAAEGSKCQSPREINSGFQA